MSERKFKAIAESKSMKIGTFPRHGTHTYVHRSSHSFPTRSSFESIWNIFRIGFLPNYFYPKDTKKQKQRLQNCKILNKPAHDSCSHRIRKNSVIFIIYVPCLQVIFNERV